MHTRRVFLLGAPRRRLTHSIGSICQCVGSFASMTSRQTVVRLAVSILIECRVRRRRHPHTSDIKRAYQKVARLFFWRWESGHLRCWWCSPTRGSTGSSMAAQHLPRHKEHFIAVCCIDLNIRGLISSPPCCVVWTSITLLSGGRIAVRN